jgi:hypothetical protein
MTRINRREIILFSIIGLFLLTAVGGISYYLGYQRNNETVKLMERQQYIKDDQYGTSLKNVQKENDDLATKNTVICGEYQKLYQAYSNLYVATPGTMMQKYTIPGSAKGQVDPCYESVAQ